MKRFLAIILCLLLVFPVIVFAEEPDGGALPADGASSGEPLEKQEQQTGQTGSEEQKAPEGHGEQTGQEEQAKQKKEDAAKPPDSGIVSDCNEFEGTGVVPAFDEFEETDLAFDCDELEETDVVYDWTGLKAWLHDHHNTGGTVTLGGNIEITGAGLGSERIGTNRSASRDLFIQAGPYSIIANNRGGLLIGSNVNIIGDGDENPIIRVRNGSNLSIEPGSYNTAPVITVTGDYGVGLKLDAGAVYSPDFGSLVFFKAEGRGSVAIDSEIGLDLRDHYIQATGSGARGIVSSKPVRLLLSRVTANGTAITAPCVTLDTCIVSPAVPGANVINRKITHIRPRFFPLPPFIIGLDAAGLFGSNTMRYWFILSAEGVDNITLELWTVFDDSKVDYNTPCWYYLLPFIPPPYDAFDLICAENPAFLTVGVIDPNIPFLRDIKGIGNVCQGLIKIEAEHFYFGEIEDLKLWRSDDDGKSWYIYWRYGDKPNPRFEVELSGAFLYLDILDLSEVEKPAWFVYEVGKGKGSYAFYINPEDFGNEGLLHGDRDGGDRVERPFDFFFRVVYAEPEPPRLTGNNNTNLRLSGTEISTDNNSNAETPDNELLDNLILEPANPFMLLEAAEQGYNADAVQGYNAQTNGSAAFSGLSADPNGNFYFDLGNSGNPMELRFDFPFDEFDGLYVNGGLWIPGVDYTARAGSTIITITPARLERLGAGINTLAAVFAGETVEVVFTLNMPGSVAEGHGLLDAALAPLVPPAVDAPPAADAPAYRQTALSGLPIELQSLSIEQTETNSGLLPAFLVTLFAASIIVISAVWLVYAFGRRKAFR